MLVSKSDSSLNFLAREGGNFVSVIVKEVEKNSPADKAGIKSGDTLISLNGEQIVDVLDYRFYQNNSFIIAEIIDNKGEQRSIKIEKDEYSELGLIFDTYLMDEKHFCKNKCIFCFIDQLPRGLRKSLYFKDDDSRLSFLFGNYITLTNLTDHEINRIIKMHISPINISVHTTNPSLRVKMMRNENAGNVLEIIDRFNEADIKINCQLVLCPGFNDGDELLSTLKDLTSKKNVECIAAVPVGLTKFRDKLTPLSPFNEQTAGAVLDIIDRIGDECIEKWGERRVYGSDEFYLLSKREIPNAEYYGDFLQLENGVGLWSLLKSESNDALLDLKDNFDVDSNPRKVSIATGVAAYPLIKQIADKCMALDNTLCCNVYPIKNDFFGEKITVAGLVTATDIINQLKDKELGEELLIPSVMLRSEGDMFLDSITLEELSSTLNVKITPVDNDGYALCDAIFGITI
ncbi:MAG: DUF512 domain-containing protein [Oscillospiraceae bacterium]|nr:DUF512 domain-containing protein [Oscillospiraceae bacterium]